MERDVAADPAGTNRRFYDDLWNAARLPRPERLNTWPLLSRFAESDGHALEVGPGRVGAPEVDEIIAISDATRLASTGEGFVTRVLSPLVVGVR